MTCIIGYKHSNEATLLVADQKCVDGLTEIYGQNKIFRYGNLFIGFSGAVRIANIIEGLNVDRDYPFPEHGNYDQLAIRSFVGALRRECKAQDASIIDSSRAHAEAWCLLALPGSLYAMYGDYSYVPIEARRFHATGSGGMAAMGSLSAQSRRYGYQAPEHEADTETMCKLALTDASLVSVGVGTFSTIQWVKKGL